MPDPACNYSTKAASLWIVRSARLLTDLPFHRHEDALLGKLGCTEAFTLLFESRSGKIARAAMVPNAEAELSPRALAEKHISWPGSRATMRL
jgi:hypothetical protein